jgi:hypothetical protein
MALAAWLKLLVAGFSTLSLWFNNRVVHVGFVVDETVLGHVFLRSFQFYPICYRFTVVPYSFLCRAGNGKLTHTKL